MSMKENAIKYFKSGYSCSESIVKAVSEAGLCSAELLPIATSFSGGMSSGCVCGTLAAAQLINGYNFGRENTKGNEPVALQNSARIVADFKKSYNGTGCSIL